MTPCAYNPDKCTLEGSHEGSCDFRQEEDRTRDLLKETVTQLQARVAELEGDAAMLRNHLESSQQWLALALKVNEEWIADSEADKKKFEEASDNAGTVSELALRMTEERNIALAERDAARAELRAVRVASGQPLDDAMTESQWVSVYEEKHANAFKLMQASLDRRTEALTAAQAYVAWSEGTQDALSARIVGEAASSRLSLFNWVGRPAEMVERRDRVSELEKAAVEARGWLRMQKRAVAEEAWTAGWRERSETILDEGEAMRAYLATFDSVL